MRLIAAVLACLCATASAAAFADELEALDLVLPKAPVSTFNSDPPGTWYGDRSGVPAAAASTTTRTRARWGCPTSPDGGERAVTGSFTTGVGYSSDLGSSTYNGANLGYCKTYVDDDGGERTINLQMHVDRYDGPDMRQGPYRGSRGPR
ncbi:hypothetical protein MNQ95_08970 [Pseudoxanthomonas daejeonensis]|uniref:Uncharacterized protein n=1 Tax=Pseudoxanthomonas daejeonensis TaxID=266062 RepID=A0ABQ6Z3P7_9GAMM|nr:hypothetical protein [Pseudoxanthomonas daejeonensis]KAF1692240.1 hypothetical protein CSC65_14865 [Pseudoxanthomonas daejeonensis]UNK56307.1 hypothetical protein MNQ95_08970 [Pseudoxanthomonas daejeonensis]